MKTRAVATMAILALTAVNYAAARHMAREDAPQKIAITARRYEFSPAEITVKKGVPVTISLTSQDFSHGIKFTEPAVTLYGAKGETKEVTFTATQAGDFVGQCSSFCGSGHGGMQLVMHVTE